MSWQPPARDAPLWAAKMDEVTRVQNTWAASKHCKSPEKSLTLKSAEDCTLLTTGFQPSGCCQTFNLQENQWINTSCFQPAQHLECLSSSPLFFLPTDGSCFIRLPPRNSLLSWCQACGIRTFLHHMTHSTELESVSHKVCSDSNLIWYRTFILNFVDKISFYPGECTQITNKFKGSVSKFPFFFCVCIMVTWLTSLSHYHLSQNIRGTHFYSLDNKFYKHTHQLSKNKHIIRA